jgi:hypothetical protein
VLPLSFRLVVLDNDLLIKKSLGILIQNGECPDTDDPLPAMDLADQSQQQLFLRRSGTPITRLSLGF